MKEKKKKIESLYATIVNTKFARIYSLISLNWNPHSTTTAPKHEILIY